MTAFSYRVLILALLVFFVRRFAAIPLGSVVYVTSEDMIWETVIIMKTIVLCSKTLDILSSTRLYTTTSLQPCISNPALHGREPRSSSSISIPTNTTTLFGNFKRLHWLLEWMCVSKFIISKSMGIHLLSFYSIWYISLYSTTSKQYSLKLAR